MRNKSLPESEIARCTDRFFADLKSGWPVEEVADQFISSTGIPFYALFFASERSKAGDFPKLVRSYVAEGSKSSILYLKNPQNNNLIGLLRYYSDSETWILYSPDVSGLLHPIAKRLAHTCYPWSWRPSFTSSALCSLTTAPKKQFGVSSIRVHEYVYRSYIPNQAPGKKKVRSQRGWTDEDIEVVMDRVKESGSWFTSLKSSILTENEEICRYCIKKNGEVVTYRNFAYVHKMIITPARFRLSQHTKFYQERSTEDSDSSQIEPVIIEYDHPIFKDNEQNHRLLEVLHSFPKSTTSVLHGNPYIRASMLSYKDGSGYNIWVLSHNRILIKPKKRCTSATLESLCSYICDHFQDGSAVNYSSIHSLR